MRASRRPLGLVAIVLLPGISVAQEPDSVPYVEAEPIAVTIVGDSLTLVETPRAVTVLEADRTRRGRPGRGLEETMRGIPGVQVEDRGSEALDERIVVRGFGARAGFGVRGVQVLVDGIPATMPDGQTALTHVDPRGVARVEAVRGPAAEAWGNAAGGAIAIETRGPPRGTAASATTLRARFGTWRAEASVGTGDGATGWRVDASRVETDGHRAFDRSEITRAGARWSRGSWEVVGSAALWDARNPGGLTDSLRAADPDAAFPLNVAQRTGEKGTHGQVGATWRGRVGGAGVEVGGWLLGRSIDNPIPPVVVDLERVAGGARGLVRGTLAAGPRWTAGAEIGLQRDERRNFENEAGSRGARTLDQLERVRDVAVWGSLAVPWGERVTATLAVRYDRTRFEADDRLVGPGEPDDSGDRSLDAWSPLAAVMWRPAPGVGVWANVATAFETPTTAELANRPDGTGGFDPDLEPQDSWTVEAGTRLRLGRVEAEAVAFRTSVDDALVPFQVPEQPGRDFFRNAGSTTHRGVELAGRIDPGNGFTARASWAWIDATFDRFRTPDGVFDGRSIPGVRPRTFDGAVGWSSSRWLVELEVRAASRMAVDDANDAHSAGRAIVDLRVDASGLRWGGLELDPFAGVTNLLDRDHDTAVVPNAFGGRFFEPGPGRSLYVGLSARV